MDAPIFIEDRWTIRVLRDGSRCHALEYIESLQKRDQKKLLALLQRTSQEGPRSNDEKFKKIEGDVFEFKSYQDRLFCFFRGHNTIVITHGFRKKRDRTLRSEIDRALQLRTQFLEGEDI